MLLYVALLLHNDSRFSFVLDVRLIGRTFCWFLDIYFRKKYLNHQYECSYIIYNVYYSSQGLYNIVFTSEPSNYLYSPIFVMITCITIF